jgi:hypothetical protein
MRNIAIRVGIVALIIVGGLILRPFLSGNASDLAVGDCFDEPTGAAQEVENVQHHPCNEAHTGEVFLVQDVADAPTYPSEDGWIEEVSTRCLPAFATYTGVAYEDTQTLDIGWLTPTAEGWTKGDRELICYVRQADGSATSTSAKAGN